MATSTEHDEVLGRVLLFSDRDACLELLRAEEQAPHDASSLRLDWMRLERAALASRHLDVTATRLRNEDVAALRSHVESLPASILTYRALLAAFILQRDDEGPRELDRTLAALRRVADAFPDDMELHFGAYATSAEVALRRGQGWEEIRTKALQAVDRVPPHRSGPRVMFETEIAGFEASLGWFDQAMERARAYLAQFPGPEADERWYKTPLVLAVSMTFRGEWEEARRWLDVCVAQRTFSYIRQGGLGQLGLLLAWQGRSSELRDLIETQVPQEAWMPEESVWQAERFIPRLLRAHAIAPDDPGAARRLLEPILAARDVREVIFAAEGCLLAAKLAVIEPHLDPVADDAYRDRVRHASTQLLTHGSLERAWLSEITTRLDAAADKVSPQAWQNCVEAWAGIQANFRAAECSLELAQASLKVGNRDQAVVALINAWETAAALGAEPLEGRSRSLAARSRIGLPGAQEGRDRDIGLTAREQEVLAVLVTGATNDEISQALFISPKTVSVHVSHILAKLDATNRTEVAVLAQRRGWV